ncbi:hypothetical protein [Litorimonas sp.]|uniref:glucuronyl esterase domain-containing protein n=1 Tax=Litorimonas sp. TaxID=1892381 RepID=UPI003A895E68
MMKQAPLKPEAYPELPELESSAEMIQGLEENIYGKIPALSDVTILSKQEIARDVFTKGDIITEWEVEAGFGKARKVFHIVFIRRADFLNDPMIITQNFCPNTAVVPIQGVTPPIGEFFDCSDSGPIASIFSYFFGRYITVPPYKMILQHGYGVAVMFPSEFIPDSAERAPVILEDLFLTNVENQPGVLAVWSSLSVWLAEALKADGEVHTTITYGHSRYGKTALISAAVSPSIDAVIAHQSGTGGASLLRDETGESIAQVLENYPHWFTSNFASFAYEKESLPVDSHFLLSLIAPRPLLLGNARRDVWSDPAGAFNAARAASPSWAQYGSQGLSAARLDDYRPQDDLAFWMRPGTHGVVEEDWPAFLEFLDAHFK